MSLPGILRHVEEIAGTAKALELAREYGGVEISISDAPNSALVRVLGEEVARALVKRLAREKVVVPMATGRGAGGRRAAAAAMIAAGASQRQAALACDIHLRTAKRVTAKAKEDLPLFGKGDRTKG